LRSHGIRAAAHDADRNGSSKGVLALADPHQLTKLWGGPLGRTGAVAERFA
jgi:hypothetical protein